MSTEFLTPFDVSRGMRRSILASIFGSFFVVCVAPQFLNGFAVKLGASEVQIAMITSLPMLGLTLQFFSILFLQYLPRRKPAWFLLATVHRLLWLVIALVPFAVGLTGNRLAIAVFLGVFFVSGILGSMSAPLWLSWMADLVPKEQAGKFWGRRVGMVSLVQMAAIPVGWFADRYAQTSPIPYGIIFLIAAVVGQVEITIQRRVAEPRPTVSPKRSSMARSLLEILRHGDFQRFAIFTCAFNFSSLFASSFLIFFYLKQGVSQLTLATAVTMMWMMRWATARYWGFLGDRFGHASVLRLCGFALCIWPLGVVFFGHSHPVPSLISIHLYTGFFNAGFETAYVSVLLRLVPKANKTLLVSLTQALGGAVAALAPLLGGIFLQWFARHPILGSSFDRFEALFLVETLMRLTAMSSVRLDFKEIAGASTALLIRRLMDANPFKVLHHSYVLNEGVRESERVDAVEGLAESGSGIATEQLVRALRDPSLEVRRGAVRALLEIGDRSVVPHLMEAAGSSHSQIQVEAAEALGRLGDSSAIPLLLKLQEQPSLRLAALRGLGELRAKEAAGLFRDFSLRGTESLELRTTAFEGWCRLGDAAAIGPCLHFIRGCREDLPRWQTALGLARMTVAPVDFYSALHQELRVQGDLVASEGPDLGRLPSLREKPKRLRKVATHFQRMAQTAYMEGRWAEAVDSFLLATLVGLEIEPWQEHAVQEHAVYVMESLPSAESALRHLRGKISELAITRSQILLSLRLAEALLGPEGMGAAPATQEEAIMAWCLMTKLLAS